MKLAPVMKRFDENPNLFHGRLLKSREVSGFVFHDLEYQSGMIVDKHVHSTGYVALLLRGTATEISTRGQRKLSQAGLTSFRPPFTEHANLIGDGGTRAITIAISKQASERIADYGLKLQTATERSDLIFRQFSYRILQNLRDQDTSSSISLEGLTLEILAELFKPQRATSAVYAPRMRQVLALLHDKFKQPISLSQIAKEVDLHPAYLARAFRRKHNLTIGDYLRRLRIEQSCKMLIGTTLSVSEIAAELGFADHSHYCRIFKRIVGTSPSRFRTAHHSG